MKYIEFNAYKHGKHNASSKAKTDVSEILRNKGYIPVYNPSKYRIIRVLQQIWALIRLPKDTLLFVQYPSHSHNIYSLLFCRKKVKKIALIHDLQSLRGLMNRDKEIACLNKFDVVISHNQSMSTWLKANGVKKPIYNIYIFDYLLNEQIKINTLFDKYTIFFAGNLQKSNFLTKLNQLTNLRFNIYGSAFDGIKLIQNQPNVTYEGSFSPDELIANLKGGWGLVWDGDSLGSCTGVIGEYLKYNNPHKVSMCIVSERPVIIWKQSAMASYVESKGIGICVESLFEVYDKIREIDIVEYKEILERVVQEKKRLIRGLNLISVIRESENFLGVTKI